MSVSDAWVVYIDNVRIKEVLNMNDDFYERFKKQWKETFGEEYVPKKMTEEERIILDKAYAETFDYEPSEEEVKKRYSKEFNDWLGNL